MSTPENHSDFVDLASDLLIYYSFEVAGQSVDQLIESWIQEYPSTWLRAAVIEALYQGRYKAISVGHILSVWNRRGHPICHFNLEFERMVSEPVVSSLSDILSTNDELKTGELKTGELKTGEEKEGAAAKESNVILSPQPSDSDTFVSHHFEKAEQFIHGATPYIQDLNHDHESTDEVVSFEPHSSELPQSGALLPSQRSKSRKNSDSLQNVNGIDSQVPIHKFVPQPESSGFYSRLQAMASSDQALAQIGQQYGSWDPLTSTSTPLESPFEPESLNTSLSLQPTPDDVQLPPQPTIQPSSGAIASSGHNNLPEIPDHQTSDGTHQIQNEYVVDSDE